ncbi:MAG: hypothetical protein ABI840_05220 [bacterium]
MSENNINSDAESQDQPETPFNKSEKDDQDEIFSGISKEDISLKNEDSPVNSPRQETTTHKIPVKRKEGNYQISLIKNHLLKVLVLTKRGVTINSTVIDKKTSAETQSNEIYLNPKPDFGLQEVEIMIEAEEKNTGIVSENAGLETNEEKDSSEESIFRFDTINENLLKIKIITSEGVKIDSITRDKKTSIQTQSNRIYLQPKSEDEIQEVNITIAIELEKEDFKEDLTGKTEDGKFRLIPNPEVVDLIQQPDYSSLSISDDPYSTEDFSGYGSGFKNPFDALRSLIRKNLIIGIIAAVSLHLVAAAFAFYGISKNQKSVEPEEPSRLIIIQDLPDPKIRLENVEDPNKPKVEPNPIVDEPDIIEPKREITPRKIRPPIVTRPKREPEDDDVKLDSSVDANLTRELDSLRLLVENTGTDTALADSTNDSTTSTFDIPDSLRNYFSENDINLAMYYPKNWKLIDVRDIDKQEKVFKGLIITDTTASQPGTMNLFISLDPEGKEYKAEDFKTEFKMNDSTLRAYFMEPKASAGSISYKFYIFNNLGTEKLLINAQLRQQFFDQYKNEIEAVVRSIRIRKKENL